VAKVSCWDWRRWNFFERSGETTEERKISAC